MKGKLNKRYEIIKQLIVCQKFNDINSYKTVLYCHIRAPMYKFQPFYPSIGNYWNNPQFWDKLKSALLYEFQIGNCNEDNSIFT